MKEPAEAGSFGLTISSVNSFRVDYFCVEPEPDEEVGDVLGFTPLEELPLCDGCFVWPVVSDWLGMLCPVVEDFGFCAPRESWFGV